MLKVLNRLFQLGVSEEMTLLQSEKVRITNQIAFFTSLAALPFVFICYLSYRELTIIPVIALFCGALVITLNFYRRIDLSRIVAATSFPILCALFHAFLVQDDLTSITGLFVVQFGLSLIPFVVFDLREYVLIIPVVTLNFALLLLFDTYNEWFSLSYSDEFFRTGEGHILCVIVGVAIGLLNVFLMIHTLQKHTRKTEIEKEELQDKYDSMQSVRLELETTLNEVSIAREAEEIRNWQNTGAAQFANMLREVGDSEIDLNDVLTFIVKYFDAAMGAIYLVSNDKGDVLIKMEACYAWERKKHITAAFEPGEGLVGQSYMEGDYIHLSEIPEDYIKIRSGGIEIPPRSLLIVPMELNNQIEGFIEISSVKVFEEHHINLLQQLCETLAVSLSTERTNSQTRRLLLESQTASEALRSQEEELRQNMEELAATQEEMDRRNAERERLFQESKAKTRSIELFQKIASAISNIESVQVAAETCLRMACEDSDWSMGNLVLSDPDNPKQWKATGTWYCPDKKELIAFREASMQCVYDNENDLAVQVVSRNKAVWLREVEKNLARQRKLEGNSRLKSAAGFPIFAHGKVIAVMELFSTVKISPDAAFQEMMGQIGYIIGRIYMADQQLRESEATINDLTEQLSASKKG